MVVPSTEPTRCEAEAGINTEAIEETDLGEIESCLLLVNREHAYELIEYLGYPQRSQLSIAASEQPLNAGRRWFIAQIRDDSEAVEDSQRRRRRAASSARSDLRASSAVGALWRYRPRSSTNGRGEAGRITTRSPRSTTTSRRVFQRVLTSAGTET